MKKIGGGRRPHWLVVKKRDKTMYKVSLIVEIIYLHALS